MNDILKKHKTNIEVEAIDINTMEALTPEEYKLYLESEGLFMVDHHEILRSSCAGYPIAATKEQVDILIEELSKIRHKLR
ncbi:MULTISPECIES: hypothetical protein [unclassified Endozoicomonas]|uniref:hypothetical protein n=1 Tax=unclassified Endozoicomonas TaxID=2644528 RepID=UPI003BB546F2